MSDRRQEHRDGGEGLFAGMHIDTEGDLTSILIQASCSVKQGGWETKVAGVP